MAVLNVSLTCRCGRECHISAPAGADERALRCTSCGGHLLKFRLLSGYVYVLSNPRMPGLLKVGCTTREVAERVDELNGATGVPAPFTVEAYFASSAPEEHEAQIHGRLNGKRIKGKEFFEAPLTEVVQTAQAVVGAEPIYARGGTNTLPKTIMADGGTIWSCGLCKHESVVQHRALFFGCPLCSSQTIVCLRHLVGPDRLSK